MNTENQPHILFNSEDSYEEDLKIWIWKMTSTIFSFFQKFSSSLVRINLHTKNKPSSLLNSGNGYEKTLKSGFGRRP